MEYIFDISLLLYEIFYRLLRSVLPIESLAFSGRLAERLQPFLETFGRLKARALFRRALRDCPAYRDFIQKEVPGRVQPDMAWERIPCTTKQSYIRPYPLEARCFGGALPGRGVVIHESSGSSGVPSQWLDGSAERAYASRVMSATAKEYYRRFQSQVIVLNCYAMGPWGTGIAITSAIENVAMVKSIGPDAERLENTLKVFGPKYGYILCGYPPFFKGFLDGAALNLKDYRMDLFVGGEGMSEGLRDYLLQTFRSVASSYGAADLEINMASETRMTIRLRRWLRQNPAASQVLFGREQPPMIFQYNPATYLVETSPDGDLIFTVAIPGAVAPKIRYNIRDAGGVMPWRTFKNRLRDLGFSPTDETGPASPFPILWLFGRSDRTVAFYSAKVSREDIETILDHHEGLRKALYTFQVSMQEDASLNPHLKIHLEKAQNQNGTLATMALRDVFYEGLMRWNGDFRDSAKMFSKEQLDVEVYDFQTGPFAGREKRIKNKYVA